MSTDRATADSLLALAIKREQRADFGDAIALLNAALELDPDHADAWLHLGELHERSGRLEASIACCRRALAVRPDSPDALVNLGVRYLDGDRPDAAVETFRRAVALEPERSTIHYNLGLALNMTGQNDSALAALGRSCELDPRNASARFARSLVLLEEGRFADGWAAYHWRWQVEQSPPYPTILPSWDGKPFDGKTLLILPEGGFGDTIWASRFLPGVKTLGGTVVLKTRPETRRLLARLEGVDGYVDDDFDRTDFDLLCPILSVPGLLGYDGSDPPPPARLYAVEGLRKKLQPLLVTAGDRFKVGIVWSGSDGFIGNRRRSAPFPHFLALAENPDVQLYSLQKGPQQAVLRDHDLGALIVDADTSDFAETAALIEALDLVVMTDSAVVHVAGSLGKPVWNILDYAPYWIYGQHGDRTRWYPDMRLFRQHRPGDWNGVFRDVAAALADATHAHRMGRWPAADVAVR